MVVKVNILCPGFKKTLLNVIKELLPLVILLLSGTDWLNMLIPGFVFEIVNVPNTKPVLISWDWIIACEVEIIELTVKIVLKVLLPELALINAVPIVSPILIDEIAKEPLSETNNAVDISGSFGSWLTEIVKSAKLSQSVFDKETETVGLNGIHATLPVLPPTQLPQLSMKAVPFGSPWQSKQ